MFSDIETVQGYCLSHCSAPRPSSALRRIVDIGVSSSALCRGPVNAQSSLRELTTARRADHGSRINVQYIRAYNAAEDKLLWQPILLTKVMMSRTQVMIFPEENPSRRYRKY